jgi:putative glutamine amidotransferase
MQPFIGITCSSDPTGEPRVNPLYVRAVHAAGGLPVPLPFVTDLDAAHALLDRVAGMVFTGSEDLDPSLWGEPLHPRAQLMHSARMTTELMLARAVTVRRTAVLAVCGGMQTLNVVRGGSLHQHIPDLAAGLEHSDPSFTRRHPVTAVAGSRLAALCGREFPVNTEHHQAVHRLGDGLVATAHAPDGLVEAWEAPDERFCMGVQWHPERLLELPGHAGLFAALTAAAGATLPAAAPGA